MAHKSETLTIISASATPPIPQCINMGLSIILISTELIKKVLYKYTLLYRTDVYILKLLKKI